MRRLAVKEQELQDYAVSALSSANWKSVSLTRPSVVPRPQSQNAELKSSQAPTVQALRSVLLDPAVNILFQKLKAELQSTKARLEDTQNELSAWKFTPDSNTGKRLMAKCRLLYQENEELGKMTSNGRLAKLEGDLALQKSFSEEVKKSQSGKRRVPSRPRAANSLSLRFRSAELDDFLQELDEDVEGMQSTILFLQQELKLAKDTVTTLERENNMLRNGDSASLQQQFKDDMTETADDSNASDNYGLNGTRLAPAEVAQGHLINSNNLGSSVSDSINSNSSNSYNSINCDRVINSNVNNCTKTSTANFAVIETRTLRNSGRNINSVVEELRTSKLKTQYVGNGNNGDSVDLISGSETKKNGSDLYDVSSTSSVTATIATTSQRKLPYKRGYVSEHKNADGASTDDDDPAIHSNASFNNNKGNCIDNNGGGGVAAGDCLASVARSKKMRRASVLSLDLNEEDTHIDMKVDDRPLNLVTPSSASAAAAAAAAASSSTDSISSPRNGII